MWILLSVVGYLVVCAIGLLVFKGAHLYENDKNQSDEDDKQSYARKQK